MYTQNVIMSISLLANPCVTNLEIEILIFLEYIQVDNFVSGGGGGKKNK